MGSPPYDDDCASLLGRLPEIRILVLGDVILDMYVHGAVTRISPEAPVPIVTVTHEDFRLGGAANVAANVAALDVACELVGVVGEDQAASDLRARLDASGIEANGIVIDSERQTSVKTRIVGQNQQIVRLDRETNSPIVAAVREEVSRRVAERIGSVEAIIVADYEKGLLDETLVAHVRDLAKAAAIPLVVDPKTTHFSWYDGVTGLTPNAAEAGAGSGHPIHTDEDAHGAGADLMERLRLEYLLITRGSDGMSLFERAEDGLRVIHIPTAAREVYDVTGAGDTVVAVFTCALAAGASPVLAARVANYAAGIVVGHLGCATTSRSELSVATSSAARDERHVRTEFLSTP